MTRLSGLARGLGMIPLDDTDLPLRVKLAFDHLGNEQRGVPESLMLQAQRALGGGVLSVLVEHIGDLTHRMTAAYPAFGYAYVKEKVDRGLRYLQHGYGFAREHDENMRNNAKHSGVPVAAYLAKAHVALDAYAAAHRKLVVYNRAQWNARQAAVALGERKFKRAELHLKRLDRHLGSRDSWDKYASEYTLLPDGSPAPFTPERG